jgi:DNA end-binding protein Ku
LLAAALEETGRVAVAKHATRGKQYLVAVRPHEEGLLLEQLYYASEIRSFDEVPREEGEVNANELELAVKLIEQAAAEEFDAGAFHDEVRDRMLELIEQKVAGQEITAAPQAEPKTQIIDLMAALKASIKDGDAGRKPAARAEKKATAKKKTTRKKSASG